MIPIKHEKNLFPKSFMIGFFKSKKENYMQEKIKEERNIKEDLKRQMKIINDKNDIIEKIKKNPNIILNLSNKRLEQLDGLYYEKIMESNMKLKQLEEQVKKLKAH